MKGKGAETRRAHCAARALLDRGCFQNCEDIVNKTTSSKLLSASFYRTCALLGDALLPRRCAACQANIGHTGHLSGRHALSNYICSCCIHLLDNVPKVRCQRCGLALGPRLQAFGWTHCRHCKPLLPLLPDQQTDCIVCCDYTTPFDQWIAQLKYGKAHGLARFLGLWLGITASNSKLRLPDLLIPVPSSAEKLKLRGYNQAALITRHAGLYLQRPVHTNWLAKIREAESQAELGRGGRLNNLQGAFIARRAIPENLRIGLVDDVITTGATLEKCVEALRKAGAKSIVTMAVCRTPE